MISSILAVTLMFAAPTSADGSVSGFVLDAAGRGQDVVVRLGGTEQRTNAEGQFRFDAASAGAQPLVVSSATSSAAHSVEVVEGRSVEVLVLWSGEGKAHFDIEMPSGTAIQSATSSAAEQATLKGRVEHAATKEPVLGAQIYIRGHDARATVDSEGQYSLQVPATTLGVVVMHPQFSTHREPDFSLAPGEVRTLDIQLAPATSQLADLVVTVPRIEGTAALILEERRESSNVSDLVGADQMKKTGDSDAASALRRVTGVTVVEGKYVYVRGLGERYSATLLDGSTLPSPDPERRVVPLNLFPSSVLGSIVVQKTYSPDLPGEFGGGAVLLRTRDIPKETKVGMSLGLGLLTGTSFQTGQSYQGGSLDALGFGAGARALPDAVADAASRSYVGPQAGNQGFTDQELEQFGEAVNTDYSLAEARANPNMSLSINGGGRFQLLGKEVGVLAGFTYGNETFNKQWEVNTVVSQSDGPRALADPIQLDETITSVSLGGIATLNSEVAPGHTLRSTTFLSRLSENSARKSRGFTQENVTQTNRLRWVEQMLLTEQLAGNHQVTAGWEADWRYLFSFATRDEPDRRDIAYIEDGTSLRLDTNDILNQRFFSDLLDFNQDGAADISYRPTWFGDVESLLKFGVAGGYKTRSVNARRFTYRGSLGSPADQLSPDRIFNPETIGMGSGRVQLDEVTLDDDSYTAAQGLGGAYAMTDLGVTDSLRIMAGTRLELAHQSVETFRAPRVTDQTNSSASLTTFDFLPALSASWEAIEDVVFRAGVSRTVARPNFRELSPAVFRDLQGTLEYQGNPNLQRTLLTHADLRGEWFPSPGEAISVSLFYKHFAQPVEQRIESGARNRFIPINIPSAQNLGAEIELRKNFGFASESLEPLYVATNLTLVQSKVNLSSLDPALLGVLTSVERPLAGQSPYAVNVQLGWDDIERDTSVTVLYNVFGPRIAALGSNEAPDAYEQPFHRLDLVARQKIGRFQLSARAANLLDPEVQWKQGDISVRRFRRGRLLSLSVGAQLW